MQGVVALLREKNEAVSRPLPRPTPEDISYVEGELGFKFPAEFVALQLGAGDVIYGSVEPVTVTKGTGHTYILEVAKDAWASGVPSSWLPICEANGDYFCLSPSGEVKYWSHNGVSTERWSSLESWVREVWLGGL